MPRLRRMLCALRYPPKLVDPVSLKLEPWSRHMSGIRGLPHPASPPSMVLIPIVSVKSCCLVIYFTVIMFFLNSIFTPPLEWTPPRLWRCYDLSRKKEGMATSGSTQTLIENFITHNGVSKELFLLDSCSSRYTSTFTHLNFPHRTLIFMS